MSRDVTIRAAHTSADREAIFALRHRVLAGEPRSIDDTASLDVRIEDPLDAHAALFGAWAGARLVGTVRSLLLADCPDELRAAWGIVDPGRADKIALTSRLLVLPEFRSTGLVLDLARTVYELLLERGVDCDYLACEPLRTPIFNRLGYRPHRADMRDPTEGVVAILRLDVWDAAHLHSVWSPFAPLLAAASVTRERVRALA